MCGIFGYIGKRNDAPSIVLTGLRSLEYRGYDSWGIASLSKKSSANWRIKNQKYLGKILVKKKAGKIGDANVNDLPASSFAIGHTRWATHGGVSDINAHPHLDCQRQLAIIHNGIIENYDEIRKELGSNHKFISDTDSEVAIHLIEENYQRLLTSNSGLKSQDYKDIFWEAVKNSFRKLSGLNAIIVMDIKSKCMIAAKNGSPLAIGKGSGENFLASDAHALVPYTKEVYFMEDDELVLISTDDIYIGKVYGYSKKTPVFSKLSLKTQDVDKGNYSHYMLKEIYDQPDVIRKIVGENNSSTAQFAKLIDNSYGTYMVGCGTAAYACLAGTYIFSKVAKKHLNWAVGSEFGYITDFLTSKSLVLALSQSGETIDVLEAVKAARTRGAKIAALVNVDGSTLFRMSDYKLLLDAGVEKAVVSTKAFTAKLAKLIMLASSLSDDVDKVVNMLKKSVTTVEQILTEKNLRLIRNLVDLIVKKQHIYVIGRGLSYPVALETALKIKEASYIHAEGFAAGELKHGVIALIEAGTPCIAFLPNDETYAASLAGVMELKARGGFIIGISFKNLDIFDYYLPVSDCGVATIIPATVIGQLLGYFLSVAKGLDPDMPRNLAKSVTVK